MCAKHIYGNWKNMHPHKLDMKSLFWKVAKSYNKITYERKLEAIRRYDIHVYEDMIQKKQKICRCAFFSTTRCCDDFDNNIYDHLTMQLTLQERCQWWRCWRQSRGELCLGCRLGIPKQ